VKLAEIAREPLITYSRKDYPDAHENLAAMFAAIKSKPRIAEEHDSVSSLIAAVEAGNGVAIAVQSLACTAGPRLKLIPLLARAATVGGGRGLVQERTDARRRTVFEMRPGSCLTQCNIGLILAKDI
jgi:DNA-binding transcriptional LysR family regulator